MDLTDLIGRDDIHVSFKASCKKQVLQDLASIAADKTGISEQEIFHTLLEREKLGSTGVGNGIAIPHGKLDKLDKIQGVVAFLENPVDFDAMDDQPVDIVFLLLAADAAGADHLKALSRIARILREPDMLQKLRNSTDSENLHQLLCLSQTPHAA